MAACTAAVLIALFLWASAALAAPGYWSGTYTETNSFAPVPGATLPGLTEQISGSSTATVEFSPLGTASVTQSVDVTRTDSSLNGAGYTNVDTVTLMGSGQTLLAQGSTERDSEIIFLRGSVNSNHVCRPAKATIRETLPSFGGTQVNTQYNVAPNGAKTNMRTVSTPVGLTGSPYPYGDVNASLQGKALKGSTRFSGSGNVDRLYTSHITTTRITNLKAGTNLYVADPNGSGWVPFAPGANKMLYGQLRTDHGVIDIAVADLGYQREINGTILARSHGGACVTAPFWRGISGSLTRNSGPSERPSFSYFVRNLYPYSRQRFNPIDLSRPSAVNKLVRLSRTPLP